MFVVVFKDGAFPNIRKAQTGFSCWVKGPSYLTLAWQLKMELFSLTTTTLSACKYKEDIYLRMYINPLRLLHHWWIYGKFESKFIKDKIRFTTFWIYRKMSATSMWSKKEKWFISNIYIYLIHTKEKEDNRMADNKSCFPDVQNTTGKCY